MIKFKIFFGSSTNQLGRGMSADDKANEWLADHPFVDILQMKYQQSRYGDHSICIMYEEHKQEDAVEDVYLEEVTRLEKAKI